MIYIYITTGLRESRSRTFRCVDTAHVWVVGVRAADGCGATDWVGVITPTFDLSFFFVFQPG
jgi:hypothetical protein